MINIKKKGFVSLVPLYFIILSVNFPMSEGLIYAVHGNIGPPENYWSAQGFDKG